jgi:K+-transporting ATPase ATPase A chain
VTAQGWLQIGIYLVLLTTLTPVIGAYMARVYRGERIALLSVVLGPLERVAYRAIRANPSVEQNWKSYARTALVFSALSWAALYLILRLQGSTPFNPEDFGAAPWDVTFNTASSFVSNTNWQFYGGETTLSYF